MTLTSDYSPGDMFPIGTATVTYTAVDSYGNNATDSFDIIVAGKFNIIHVTASRPSPQHGLTEYNIAINITKKDSILGLSFELMKAPIWINNTHNMHSLALFILKYSGRVLIFKRCFNQTAR